MTSEGTGGDTPQFLRRGTERLGMKDAPSAKLAGLDDDHLDADALLTPASSGLPESGEDGMAASGALPYDPYTNYLSPRPQFLRYNPGRLREIYLRREMGPEGAEGESSREGTPSSSLPSPLPRLEQGLGDLEPSHDEESCEDMGEEGDDDTEEEERPSWCNLVWKVLLLLGIFFSITGYISSMHSFSAPFSSQKFQTFKGDYLQTQDAVQETAANASMNSETYSGAFMHTYMDSHLEMSNLDGFCKQVEGEQPQEEGKSMVNDGLGPSVDDVTPNSNMVSTGDWSVGSAEELEGETQIKIPENSDVRGSNNKDPKDFLAMSEEEGDEYAIHNREHHKREKIVADESKLLVDNENLNAVVALMEGENEVVMNAGIVPVEVENEVFMSAGIVPVEVENEVFMSAGIVPVEAESEVFMSASIVPVEAENEVFMNAGVALVEAENERFISTDIVCNPEEENRHARDTISEEQVGDVMVATEIAETVDMTLEMDKTAESPRRRVISGCAEKDGSFASGGGFSSYGMKVAVTVLMAIAFATFTFLRFRSPSEAQTLVTDDASASSPTSGWASEGGCELPTMEKLKRDFDLLVNNTGRFGDHESYCPAVELLKERPSDSSISIEKYEELHGTHPPTVELLGEFSVAELGFSRTGYSSVGKKTTKTNGRHPQSPEMSMSNSLATVDQSPSESPTTVSALQRQPDQEKLERKQNNRQRHGAREAASTPLRRSSRIRNRVASP